MPVIAAILTIIGYSLNDTIVVFDRIRENLRILRSVEFEELINRSINETLSRTILTSFTTFAVVLALFLFGGEVIHDFAFALIVGIIVGTYSSIFIASPILILFQKGASFSMAPVRRLFSLGPKIVTLEKKKKVQKVEESGSKVAKEKSAVKVQPAQRRTSRKRSYKRKRKKRKK